MRINKQRPDPFKNPLASPELSNNAYIILGHELGHAVARINRYDTPTNYRITSSVGANLDLGMEGANIELIENRLRTTGATSMYGSLKSKDSARTSYGSHSVMDAIAGSPERVDQFNKIRNQVNKFIDGIKEKYGCH
ncbi:hypothetical protein M2447_001734 [Ereboglobus sp. PH5-10]|uniref:hypothetical protein n=1 Tax=Ereboglobus sp. PH5-10 TaxID=2940629 RepID=UPI00240749FA|nr:hypothetical protein [Ereboglobus sp. PH5-10]MDF9827635.1 hypothetical protein [Ereboglobus sp. PH5-10]